MCALSFLYIPASLNLNVAGQREGCELTWVRAQVVLPAVEQDVGRARAVGRVHGLDAGDAAVVEGVPALSLKLAGRRVVAAPQRAVVLADSKQIILRRHHLPRIKLSV